MVAPTLSPDGKFMWTGSEWIPAPPGSTQTANVNLQDSVVGGDVNITQNHNQETLTCPNCGAIGSVLLACGGQLKQYPGCRQIDYCSVCWERAVEFRLRKTGELGDSFWDPFHRKSIKCNRCWAFWCSKAGKNN